jgi:large subunit ribosomal protein L24
MNKIRTGDDVMVLAGRDKGQRGSVVKVLDDGRLIVQGVNMVKRHTKPNPMQNQPHRSRRPGRVPHPR